MEQNTALSGGTRGEAPASSAVLRPGEPGAASIPPAPQVSPVHPENRRYSAAPAPEKALVLADWLEAGKAADVTVIDVTGLNPCMDALIVATATSARHARALADGLLEQSRLHEYEYLRMEGYQAGQWVLVDLNDVVVHLFLAETRELYRIEALWRDAPLLRSPAPVHQASDRAGSPDGSDDASGMEGAHTVPTENVF